MNLHIKLNGLLNNDASIFYSTRITSTKYFSLFGLNANDNTRNNSIICEYSYRKNNPGRYVTLGH